uniref:Uncharacterized protein n=1 Tax=Physcomitrium patens TaxID=3218 RepID=A0A2K1IHV9_PHYPA|nr:hypothetical protein PHYPA_027558 [Physcomitrium patens]
MATTGLLLESNLHGGNVKHAADSAVVSLLMLQHSDVGGAVLLGVERAAMYVWISLPFLLVLLWKVWRSSDVVFF